MSIGVAIISRFRSKLLKKCLRSLQKQSRIPDKVILVLSSKDRDSLEFTERFANLKFIVKFQNKKNYALSRNTALKASKSDFLYFVDDDCMLTRQALEEALKFLQKHKDYSAVQGKVINQDTSFYSQFAQWTNDLWLKRLWDKKDKTLQGTDTKNVCFRRKSVERFSFFECLGSEDVDFGLQISTSGGKIGFEKKMLAYHYEQANNLVSYLLKRLRMARGISIVKNKWGRLPIFYQEDRDFNQKIATFFKKSPYFHSVKYRIIFKLFLIFRSFRFLIEEN